MVTAQSVPARGNILGSLIPARYVLAILGSMGMAIVYGLKVNLSVAMVAMLNHTAIQHGSSLHHGASHGNVSATTSTLVELMSEDIGACIESGKAEALENGPFDWSEPLQGTILSCYFWGYIISQIPGARLAENFSAKWVMFFSVAINAVCTLLTPYMARVDYVAMILMRILEGIGGGVTFPAMHVMLASWAPPNERSIMSSIVYAGISLGTVSSMLMAGLLADSYGWQSVFYVMGALSGVWMMLWVWLVQDKPNLQPLISSEERTFIETSLKTNTTSDDENGSPLIAQKPSLPLRKILTSAPFLAILIAHVCSNWGWYMLLIELPFYMKQVLKFNIRENALVTAFPFLTMWFFSMVLSNTLDRLMKTKAISTTTARKVATGFASVVPMICLLVLCFIGCQRVLAVGLMGLAITSIGGMFCGFLSNHIDLAPNFAGTLMAITNTVATLPGIIVPIFVGEITHGNQTIDAWRTIFFVTIGLYVVEILIYSTMASGEEQPWNSKVSESDSKQAFLDAAEGTPLTTSNSNQANYTVDTTG